MADNSFILLDFWDLLVSICIKKLVFHCTRRQSLFKIQKEDKKVISSRFCFGIINKKFNKSLSSLKNKFSRDCPDINTYSVIELNFCMMKRELFFFLVFFHLFYCVRGSHVKETCQLCITFFAKDDTTATALSKEFYPVYICKMYFF